VYANFKDPDAIARARAKQQELVETAREVFHNFVGLWPEEKS
jgi:hypothetical protein